jgi:predicted deacylase
MMDYLVANPGVIPANVTVTVIPSANPDGVFKIIGKEERFTQADVPVGDDSLGRFNANGVDLNRNFDCKWKSESMWRGNVVSAGTSAFSEPEARAIRDVVTKNKPVAAIFLHSQSNAVYASECEAGILPETRVLMDTYALAAGYPSVDVFDSYEITGDAEGWLASIGIPAITVELSTHETTEWDKNLAGLKAVLAHYSSYANASEDAGE